MLTALVLGAGGFIGSHMVKRLKKDGYWVRGIDLKYPEYGDSAADEFIVGDLRDNSFVLKSLQFKGIKGDFFTSVPFDVINPLMKSINSRLIWEEQDLFLRAKMMQI
tara:strand:- start:1196 stop:1516 length:321 start_codon:yes stop_codon:yes gene_type:complete